MTDPKAKYRQKNRALLAYKQALRRAGPAAPPWLTPEHRAQILAIYQEAQAWTDQTGIKHSVDHLVPLKAQSHGIHYLCGLHVPWNLRAIPEHLNRDRSDWFPAGERPADDEDFDF